MNSLKIYNTLSRKKEEFIPLNKNSVGMYVCGPTVYDEPHIGNARPLIIFDIVYRILVNNLTNIEYIDNLSAYPNLSAVEIVQQTSNILKELNLGNMSSLRRVALAGTQGLSAINLSNSYNNINFLSAGGSIFDSSTVDDILINLNNNSVSNGTVSIGNSNSPRTNASDAAVAGLLARGWTVTVNPPV